MAQVTINTDQKLYVIPCGDGYTTWGFKNCFEETLQLAQRLKQPLPVEQDLGTMKVYDYHRELISLVNKNGVDLGTWFHLGTNELVKAVLEAARKDRMKVRIFLGDTDPDSPTCGKSWMEEFDTVGYVGRSTGTLKVPILVPPGDNGGCAILDNCIVKITGTSMNVTLYEHPKFYVPEIEIKPVINQDVLNKGYPFRAVVEGKNHANFKTQKKADDWAAYMRGERMKP